MDNNSLTPQIGPYSGLDRRTYLSNYRHKNNDSSIMINNEDSGIILAASSNI
jgi:hypothetical protein